MSWTPFKQTLRPKQNGHHFADDNFKCILFSEKPRILISISLKLVHKGQSTTSQHLAQIMAWCRVPKQAMSHQLNKGWHDSLIHIYDIWHQWVKTLNMYLHKISPIDFNMTLSAFMYLCEEKPWQVDSPYKMNRTVKMEFWSLLC